MKFHRLALVSAFSTVAALAQGLGSLTGTVTDPSGAGISGAIISASEQTTKFARRVESGPEGFFRITALRPALYDVEVQAPGFRTFTNLGVTVRADQDVSVSVRLELGSVNESIAVTADASQVDTTTATIKQVVDTQQISELPLNGRNAATLTLVVPGAVNSISNGADQGQTKTFPGAVTVSINGSRQMVTSYMLDGGNNVDEYTNVNAPFPFPDALQEFSVQTSNYNAEYGQNAGGVVNIITKSGSNGLHGDAFEFVRNAEFNARNFFAAKRDQLKRNQFGGTIGGPVVLPHIYDGHDRTFFFFGYQGTTIRNLQGAQSAFVPTPANLAGDFSDRLSASNPANPLRKVVNIINPTTGQPFAGNQISPTLFDPASLAVAKFLPQGTANGSVFYVKPISQNFYDVVSKVDHSVSDKDKLTGRYYAAHFFNQGIFDPKNILTYTDQASILSQNALIQETHIFRPELLNDFRLNYARENSTRGPASGVPNAADFGVNIYQPPAKAIEGGGISVSGFFSFGDNPPARFTRNNFTLQDDVRWEAGRHSLAFGFHGELSRVDLDNQFLRSGTFGFTSDITNDAVASFLLGKLRTFRQGNGEFKNNRNVFFGFYAQDTFRLTPRLTLNYGLRYEPILPWREIRGRTEQFRPDMYAAGKTSQVYVNAPPGLLFPGDPGVPEYGTDPYLKAFMPRFGFAYDVTGNGRTSIRGGSGIFYDSRQSGIFNNRFVDATPFSPQITITDPKGPFSNPLLGITNPFPAPFPAPKDAAFPLPVLAITYDPTGKYKPPVAYNWNLAIEHQFAGQWMGRIAYVGSHSSHLTEMIELNPAVYTPGSTLSTDARRIFQKFQFISEASQAGNANYNSLQTSAEKRLSHGLTLTANYTWSKSLDNLPVDASPGGPADGNSFAYPWYFQNADLLDRGPSDFDHTHRFVATYVWQAPVLAKSNFLLRTAAGGWQFTGLFQAQSGPPLTIMAGKDQSQTGLTRDRAVITGAPYGPGACGNVAPCVDYLNPNSFALPAIGQFGNVGKGLLRAPGLTVWDAGIFKNFGIRERTHVQFRAEFFNVLNHANFTGPAGNDSTRATVSAGGFGSIRSAADPRIGQLALKLIF
jgi:hypothetical protein